MKKALLAGILVATTLGLSAQEAVRCGVRTYLKTLEVYYPEEYAAIKAEAEKQQKVSTTYKTNGGVYTIPVVVHIVYSNDAQNIADEFVYSQIDVLNADYRRLNADATETPDAFANIAADAQIEFCLAQQDPAGVLSSGITRTETDITNWSLFVSPTADNYADNVKDAADGGADPWPRTEYLNIWVCNLGGGLLGYATPPGGPSGRDGVVIGYKYFGDDSPGGVYDKGRTATHEIGHWLGLNHIWGDDDFDPEPQCDGSDLMSDTPDQEDATYGNPSFPRLDDCAPVAPGIMFMNYMDYVDDGAMNMFTEDQANKMRSVLESTRESILSSPGCEPGGVGVNDVLKGQLIQLSTYPNPSSDVCIVEMQNFEGSNIILEIYNFTGQLIDRMQMPNSGAVKAEFNVHSLPAGEYLVKASDGAFILTQQVTVVK